MPVFGLSPEFLTPRPKKDDVQPVMFAGEGAQGAPLAELEKAKQMRATGKGEREIFEETKTPKTTGWFPGSEKAWKFEFSDKNAKFNADALKSLHGGKAVKLEELLSHPELYQYYPHVKDVIIQALTPEEEATGLRGSYNPTSNVLKLLRDPEQARSTLMHELQHMIQSKENWAQGGDNVSPAEIAKLNSTSNSLKRMAESSVRTDKLFNEYLVKIREAAGRNDIKEIERLQSELNQKLDESEELFQESEKEYKALQEKADRFKRSLSDYEIYRRLGGETESRNVQNRLMMDLLQRQSSFPPDTQEYSYEDQLSVKGK